MDVPEELHVGGGEAGCEPVVGEPRDADEDAKDGAEDYAEKGRSRGVYHARSEEGPPGVVRCVDLPRPVCHGEASDVLHELVGKPPVLVRLD